MSAEKLLFLDKYAKLKNSCALKRELVFMVKCLEFSSRLFLATNMSKCVILYVNIYLHTYVYMHSCGLVHLPSCGIWDTKKRHIFMLFLYFYNCGQQHTYMHILEFNFSKCFVVYSLLK